MDSVSNISVRLPLLDLFINKVESTGFNPNSTVEIKFSLWNERSINSVSKINGLYYKN